jgi:epoxide hydrolase-like predicted phosphatase
MVSQSHEDGEGELLRRIRAIDPKTPIGVAYDMHANVYADMVELAQTVAGYQTYPHVDMRDAGRQAAGILHRAMAGEIRPEMVEALRRIGARMKTGCITNNFTAMAISPMGGLYKAEIMRLFHHVIESARAGVRKPDPRIYTMMTDALGVEPAHCVYLDDLGINLKPARDLGMRTIKVGDAAPALTELERHVGFALGGPSA